MKTTRFFTLFAALALTISAYAYDFKDGDLSTSLYYNITSSTAPYTVEVTYQAYKIGTKTYPFYLTEVVIPSTVSYGGITYSVTSIGESAFYYCENLTSVSIPNTVTSIQSDAFRYCVSLTSITIPSSVNYIGGGAFSFCSKLASVKIPEGLTSILRETFHECSSLTSVTIPKSVTNIGYGAFWSTKLTSVTIPEGVTSIGGYAFNVTAQSPAVFSVVFNADSCADIYEHPTSGSFYKVFGALKSITIGNNVKRIPANLLRDVSLNSELTIPESVKSIGARALDTKKYFGSTLVVNCRSITPPTLATSLWAWLVRVPCDALETYKTATYWEKNIIYGSAFSGFKLTVNTNEYLGRAIQSPACDNIIVARSFRRSDRP